MRDLPHRSVIQQILSQLQAQTYLNGNVILYCIWFALSEQGRLRRPEFKKLQAALHPWHERVVMALQQLADQVNSLRSGKQWVNTEIEVANQFEQQMLSQALPVVKKARRIHNQQLQDAGHNLVTYFKTMRLSVTDELRAETLKILRLFFQDCSDAQITHALDQAINAARIDDGFVQLSLV